MRMLRVSAIAAVALAASAVGWAQEVSPVLRELEDAFIRIGERVRPAVVNIDAVQDGQSTQGFRDFRIGPWEDFFRQFGVPLPETEEEEDQGEETPEGLRPRRRPPTASGSGIIIDREGHILTNNHVVSDSTKLVVRLHTGEEYTATIVGQDKDTDIAVIKLDNPPSNLPVAELGDSDALKVGQFAVALGSPRGLEGSLSFGHVSALGRDELNLPIRLRFQNFIQTDAAINFGNSGGPLCDIEGRVIGINTAIFASGESLGFAIPINMAKEVIPDLLSHGKVVRGFLGVDDILDIKELIGNNVTVDEVVETLGLPDARGAYVNGGTIADSPAAKAGILKGDVIRKVNGNPVDGAKDLVTQISRIDPGSKVSLEIWRKGKPEEISVEIGEFPENVELARFGPDILGMRVRQLTAEIKRRMGIDRTVEGLLVVDVAKGSPADDAELEAGDIILEVQQNPVKEVDEFRALIQEHGKPGKAVLLQVLSGGSDRSKPVLIKVPEK